MDNLPQLEKKVNQYRAIITKDGIFCRRPGGVVGPWPLPENLKPVFDCDPDLILDCMSSKDIVKENIFKF